MKSRRTRLMVFALSVIAGAVAFVAYKKGWFARDTVDLTEQGRLRENPPAGTPQAAASLGWFQWRGPTRDGQAPAGPFRSDWDKKVPARVWSTPCGGGYSSCTVVGGQVYTHDRKDGEERVLCLNAESGSVVWVHAYPVDYAGTDPTYAIGPRASPSVIGNRVYTVGGAGKLLCLEAPEAAGTPRVVWEHDLLDAFDAKMPRWGVACSPLLEGDLVIVQPGGKKGAVAAFDAQSGALKWAAGANPAGYSSPVATTIGGRRTILAMLGDALLSVSPDGAITDTYPWKTDNLGNIATPLVIDDVVFISSAYQQGCALLRLGPKGDGVGFVKVPYERRGRAFQNHHSSCVYSKPYLYGFHGMGGARLKCVPLDTGLEKEDWDAVGVEKGTIILAGKHLIIQTERGDLWLVEATSEEFRPVAKVPRVLSGNNNWATPTLVDGRLYLRDETKVVCYDVRP